MTTTPPTLTPTNADYQAGWRAAREQYTLETSSAVELGYAQGLAAGQRGGPTWLNLAVVSTFAFIVGFSLAIAYFA